MRVDAICKGGEMVSRGRIKPKIKFQNTTRAKEGIWNVGESLELIEFVQKIE